MLLKTKTWPNKVNYTVGLAIWVKIALIELQIRCMRIILGFTSRPSWPAMCQKISVNYFWMRKHFSAVFRWATRGGGVSAGQVGPAGGVWTEVVLAQPGRIVGGGEHVAGGQRGREVVARLLVRMEIVLVQRLQFEDITKVSVLWQRHKMTFFPE